jgi:transcriptional regulator with XRE-family HTH domain
MCLARNIRYLRKKNNLSQDDIANLLGYKSYTTIQKWEMGVSEPPIIKLRALASRFGVDIDVLATVDIEKAELQEHLSSDPLQSYLAKLSEFLTGSPEHRQLVSDAAHVRTEDIELACQFLERLADPDSAAPDLPVLDTCNRQKDTNSDTLDTDSDTLDTFNRSQDTFRDTLDTSRDSDHVELTADTLALVRDTPEVLEAEAEYIKKMSIKPPKRGGTASPSTEGTSRKSG